METYIKRPVEVRAYQWMGPWTYTGGSITTLKDKHLIGGMVPVCRWCNQGIRKHGQITVEDGVRRVCRGDWIVMSINGCNYPVHKAVFDRTYKKKEQHECDNI